MPTSNHKHLGALAIVRRILLAIFLFGTLSAGAELLLLGHIESLWQWVPLLLIAASIAVLIFHAASRRALILWPQGPAASVRVFQVLMLLFLLSGLVGIWQHFQAKIEFKLEINPALSGTALLWEALTGATVPPVLAPGMMIQMGLLGLAYCYRHPALIKSTN